MYLKGREGKGRGEDNVTPTVKVIHLSVHVQPDAPNTTHVHPLTPSPSLLPLLLPLPLPLPSRPLSAPPLPRTPPPVFGARAKRLLQQQVLLLLHCWIPHDIAGGHPW